MDDTYFSIVEACMIEIEQDAWIETFEPYLEYLDTHSMIYFVDNEPVELRNGELVKKIIFINKEDKLLFDLRFR